MDRLHSKDKKGSQLKFAGAGGNEEGKEEAALFEHEEELFVRHGNVVQVNGKKADDLLGSKKRKRKDEAPDLLGQLAHTNAVPSLNPKVLQRKRESERVETAGKNWFDMPVGKLTEENKKDLRLLQMRSFLDPKRFYKQKVGKRHKKMPKFFQMGTVIAGATEYYSSNLTKKQRKRTMMEEVMSDPATRHYLKGKFKDNQSKAGQGKKRKPMKSKKGRRRRR